MEYGLLAPQFSYPRTSSNELYLGENTSTHLDHWGQSGAGVRGGVRVCRVGAVSPAGAEWETVEGTGLQKVGGP